MDELAYYIASMQKRMWVQILQAWEQVVLLQQQQQQQILFARKKHKHNIRKIKII